MIIYLCYLISTTRGRGQGRGRGRGRGRAAIKTRSIVDSSEEEEAIPEVEDDDHSTVLK